MRFLPAVSTSTGADTTNLRRGWRSYLLLVVIHDLPGCGPGLSHMRTAAHEGWTVRNSGMEEAQKGKRSKREAQRRQIRSKGSKESYKRGTKRQSGRTSGRAESRSPISTSGMNRSGSYLVYFSLQNLNNYRSISIMTVLRKRM
jgi:hypothetical protein